MNRAWRDQVASSSPVYGVLLRGAGSGLLRSRVYVISQQVHGASGLKVTAPWNEISPQITALLAEEGEKPGWVDQITAAAYRAFQAADVEKRCENWKRGFRDLFVPCPEAFAYDKLAWRQSALEGPVEWDDYSQRDWERMPARDAKPGFWDSLWVHFHRAALRQRHFVLERLP